MVRAVSESTPSKPEAPAAARSWFDSGDAPGRAPVALCGKVFCKVVADDGAIAVGDLLTTSGTPGHAMKAADAARAFGAVIGKALAPLKAGRGMVPILVALQ